MSNIDRKPVLHLSTTDTLRVDEPSVEEIRSQLRQAVDAALLAGTTITGFSISFKNTTGQDVYTSYSSNGW